MTMYKKKAGVGILLLPGFGRVSENTVLVGQHFAQFCPTHLEIYDPPPPVVPPAVAPVVVPLTVESEVVPLSVEPGLHTEALELPSVEPLMEPELVPEDLWGMEDALVGELAEEAIEAAKATEAEPSKVSKWTKKSKGKK